MLGYIGSVYRYLYGHVKNGIIILLCIFENIITERGTKTHLLTTDKQNALRRECTFKIDIVLEIGVAGVKIYLKITVMTFSDVLARLAQSVRPLRMIIDFYQ